MAERECSFSSLKKLLVTTDGSESASGAVREAIALSKACGAELTALYVVEFNPEYEALAVNVVEKEEESARAVMDKIKAEADKAGAKCEVSILRSVTPYKAIIEEAEARGAQLIVMGRRGRHGLARLMLGSVTARVIGHSPVNVLVVPKAATVGPKNILVATDGSIYGDKAAAEAIAISKATGAAITFVAVADDADEHKALDNANRAKRGADGMGVKSEIVILHGKAYEAIVNVARSIKADLIVMGSYGKTGLERLLMGSVTERVIGHADCAVFVAASGARQGTYFSK